MHKRKRAAKPSTKRALTVREAADYLGVGPTTIYRLISDSQLRSFLVRRCRRITTEACDEYIEEQEAVA